MTHATGNATWQDYPAGVTKITAARLENIENSADALYASEYGSGRTKRAVGRVYNSAGWSQPNADLFAQGGWTIANDTASGFTLGSTGVNSFYTIPISGRLWDVEVKAICSGLPLNAIFACKITLNTASVFSSIASDATVGNSFNGEGNICAFTACYPLSAGDKLYWSFWASTTVTTGQFFGGVMPEFTVRDMGPA